MAGKKRFFVLIIFLLCYSIQNVFARPQRGGIESNSGQAGSSEPAGNDSTGGAEQDPGMSNTEGDGQTESGNSGSGQESNGGGDGTSEPAGNESTDGAEQDPGTSNTEGDGQTESGNSGSGQESNGGGDGTSEPAGNDSTGGAEQDPAMSRQKGNSDSENGNSETESLDPGTSDPSLSEASNTEDPQSSDPSPTEAYNTKDPQSSDPSPTEASNTNDPQSSDPESNNNKETSSKGNSTEEKSSTSDFENLPIIYQATDLVLNPIEGALRIFLKALRKSGSAALDSIKELDHDLGQLVPQLGEVVQDPFKIPDLIANIAKGTVDLGVNTASRFGGVASDTLKDSTDGIGESINQGGILVKSVVKATANGTEAAIQTITDGVTAGAENVVQAAVDFIVKDCVWYQVGFTNSCIPFRIWKLIEFPPKFALKTAILPIKLSIQAALLPITLPLTAITLPFKLIPAIFELGGTAVDGAGAGAELGIEGAKVAGPIVFDAVEAGAEAGGQILTRLGYHAERFLKIFLP